MRRSPRAPPRGARERRGRCDCGDAMSRIRVVLVLALGVGLGAAGQYWYAQQPASPIAVAPVQAAAADRQILYYRDPSGAPRWSARPTKDAQGRDFLPVYDDEQPSFPAAPAKPKTAAGNRRILYYRNPMGLPDTSPVPKKDSMGMDYIAVYEGDDSDDGSVKLSPGKIQRTGVKSEAAMRRLIRVSIKAPGTIQ